MLRTLPRAAPSYISLRASSIRSSLRPSKSSIPVCVYDLQRQQRQYAVAHAISNPTLAGIEKRWEEMPPQEQAELWMALRDRMKNDWNELTLQERKSAYWIAFGPHGPRALDPPGETWMIVRYVLAAVGGSAVVMWLIRSQAGGPPSTMNQEWQEATNEYLRNQNVEPITGVSSEGYKGKGQVQSKPKRD